MTAPIRFTTKTEIYPLILLLLSYTIGLYLYSQFPERVASHWNFAGEVDGYTDKFTGAFMIPLLLTGMYGLFRFLPLVDPRKDRYPEFADVYHKMRYFILSVLFIIYTLLGLYNLGVPVRMDLIIPVLIGGMMIVIGNWMGKMKPNWFMGIRTPWTLASDVVWNKTHRFGGYLFVLLGILIMLIPFALPQIGLALLIGGVIITVFGTALYSYIIYRQEERRKIT